MEAPPALDAVVRKTVFQSFLREGSPPPVEQLMGELGLSRREVEASLDRLDVARHLKLVPGTHRVLMAFPFSAIATPHRVRLDNGRSYFANCAWDAVAFYPMLRVPIEVHSFCHHCGQPITFAVRDGRAVSTPSDPPIVYLGLPAAEWWNDIISTCANTMLFFASSAHLRAWRSEHPEATGAELSLDLTVRLSEPLYSGKLEVDFARPSHDRMVQLFRDLQLTGEFWKI